MKNFFIHLKRAKFHDKLSEFPASSFIYHMTVLNN